MGKFAATIALVILAASVAQAAEVQMPAVLLTLIEEVDVPAREAGVLDTVAVREGQTVKPGELLVSLEDIEARLKKDRAQLELTIAQMDAKNDLKVRFAAKSLDVARAELRRANESVEKYRKSISESELDTLRLNVTGGELEVEQAQKNLAIAAVNCQLKENELAAAAHRLEQCRITAPIAGMVVQIKRHRGEWLEPGQSVMRLVRLDRLRAEGFVAARELGENINGRPVTLSVDLPGRSGAKFTGKVVFVSPEINAVNGQVRVWAEIENAGLELRPGNQAAMTILGGALNPRGEPRS
ncbi:MAG TPA: efflux RND transporter periplasmic adaptor subunit [Pirellulales bacterium]|nr:efflux RND transporter periplasmic adaptor subunit [Pirellulales bacterium]